MGRAISMPNITLKMVETYEPQYHTAHTDNDPAENNRIRSCFGLASYPVQRMAACRLYSLENTKGTIPCGRAAYTNICAYNISAIFGCHNL